MERDRWHFQQGSTTAASIDKLRLCNGYLCIYCSDAARILDMNAATGGHTNQLAKVDLDIFLDAAHGDEFSHATMKAREKALARPVRHPQEQVQPPQGLHIEDTNVHIMFLQQDCIFTDYWAQMASRKAVGLAQRCLFSFGGDMDPAPVDLSTFKDPTLLLFLIYLFCFLLVILVLLPSRLCFVTGTPNLPMKKNVYELLLLLYCISWVTSWAIPQEPLEGNKGHY